MDWNVLIAHAEGEELLAEQLAEPLRHAGYKVAHRGTVMVGESVCEEASKVLLTGGPVVLCGTVKALGTGWAHRLINAVRQHQKVRVFAVHIDKEAYIQMLTLDDTAALYWQDPEKATRDLVASLEKYYPLRGDSSHLHLYHDAEKRYRDLALESCDIIDLANLPENDRHIATRLLELRRLYVALRVQVEIASGVEVSDNELEAIEKRRENMRQRSPFWGEEAHEKRQDKLDRVAIGHRLAEARRLVVLGDPGAGKTTMMRWIATAYLLRLKQDPDWKDLPDVATLPDENWLPIIVRCRDLDPSCLPGSLEDMLCHTLRKAEMTGAESSALRSILKEKLHHAQAILLLDGLDEISDPALRARFCQQIEQIHIAYPKAPIIATSRIVGYREMGYRIGRGFEHVTVADLSREDKDDFARRWCAVTEPPERRETAISELIHDIHSTDRIERLTGNPMLLTTMALVKRKVGKLPNRRADLYWDALEVLLNWRREVDTPIDHREAIPQLEYLAYTMCDRGVQQLREDEVIDLFERMREDYPQVHAVKNHTPGEFLHLLERRTGILIEAGHVRHCGRPVPVFEFRHLTFQEYLAGLALVDGKFPGRDRSRSLAEYVAPLAGRTSEIEDTRYDVKDVAVTENWREALRLCLASCNDDDVDNVLLAILNPIENEDPKITARPRAVLAALCLADEPNASEKTAHAVLQEFIRQVGPYDGGELTTSLTAAVMELAMSRWTQALCSLLIEEFCRRDATIRWNVGSLCGMVNTVSVPQEVSLIHNWLINQAGLITTAQEMERIDAALAIMYLAFKGRAHLVPGMIEGLLNMLKGSAPTAHAAAWALAWLSGGPYPETPGKWIPSPEELDQCLSFFSDPALDSQAWRLLSWIIRRCHDERATEPLIARLEDQNSEVRKVVAIALGKIKDIRAVEPLISRLEDQDSNVRKAVAKALGEIKDTRVVEPLIARLEDQDGDVRKAAALAIGEIKDERAVKLLIARLEDQDSNMRQPVAIALGKIKDIRAVEPLIARLEDQNSDMRQAAAKALGEIKDARAVEPLIARLEDQNSDVRRTAADALGRIGIDRAIEILTGMLSATDQDSRISALGALALRCEDEIERKLLSRDFDAAWPFLDPKEVIDETRVRKAAEALGMAVDEIFRRYELLTQQFPLKLAYTPTIKTD